MYDEERKREEQRAVKCIKKTPKYFYQFVRSHCGKREAVATLKSISGRNIESDKEKKDLINKLNIINQQIRNKID